MIVILRIKFSFIIIVSLNLLYPSGTYTIFIYTIKHVSYVLWLIESRNYSRMWSSRVQLLVAERATRQEVIVIVEDLNASDR